MNRKRTNVVDETEEESENAASSCGTKKRRLEMAVEEVMIVFSQ